MFANATPFPFATQRQLLGAIGTGFMGHLGKAVQAVCIFNCRTYTILFLTSFLTFLTCISWGPLRIKGDHSEVNITSDVD